MQKIKKTFCLLEVFCFAVLVTTLLWVKSLDNFKIAIIIIPAWIGVSWRLRNDNWQNLGLLKETKSFWIAAFLATATLFIAAYVIKKESFQASNLKIIVEDQIRYLVWVSIQELVLQSYLANRLNNCFKQKSLTIIFASSIFSLFHFPNPPLMIGAFFLGIITVYFFLKLRNIYILILVHGMLGLIYLKMIACNLVKNSGAIGPAYWQ